MNQTIITYFLTIILFFPMSQVLPQNDTLTSNEDLLLCPDFFSVTLEATTIIFIREFGAQFDFNLLGTKNNSTIIGTRISIEHWSLRSLGGSVPGSPFTTYNLFARLTSRRSQIWITAVGGISDYSSSNPILYPNGLIPRVGFEILFNFANKGIFGIVIKGVTGFRERTGFVGLGILIGYHN